MKRKFQNREQDRIEGYLENDRVESKVGGVLPCAGSKVRASSWGWGEVKVPREFPGTEPKFSQEP